METSKPQILQWLKYAGLVLSLAALAVLAFFIIQEYNGTTYLGGRIFRFYTPPWSAITSITEKENQDGSLRLYFRIKVNIFTGSEYHAYLDVDRQTGKVINYRAIYGLYQMDNGGYAVLVFDPDPKLNGFVVYK